MKHIEKKWSTAPISAMCEVLITHKYQELCGNPTTHAYPAMGHGWMSLCYAHAQQHLENAKPITELILAGEVLIRRDRDTPAHTFKITMPGSDKAREVK